MVSTLNDFQIIKKLGDGAYSQVYKVRRSEDQAVYALKKVKMLNLSDKEKENALNEVRILASINHQNVIAYKEAFIDEASSCLCLVMEYADNGDVFQKICSYQKRETYIKEKKIWYIFIQIVRGLKALHDRKILHRDMKSANIFLYRDMQAKLGDLNVSKIVKKGLSYTQTGTPYYASPEVWRDMPYDSKSDIWSLGCVLYEMCALVPPFRADDMQGLYKKVIKGKYPRIPEHFSQEMATVIKFMLQTSPSYRPNCDQILGLPIIESLIKKFFPEESQSQHLPETETAKEIMLKTIRLSKNMFSLTERLPKAQYRSPRVFGSMANDNSSGSLLPNLSRNNNASTIQPPSSVKVGNHSASAEKPSIMGGNQFQDNEGKLYKGMAKPKSRLHEGDPNSAQLGYEEEDFEGSIENGSPNGMQGSGSQPQLKVIKGKGKNNQRGKGGLGSDLEGTGDQPQIMRIASQGGPLNNVSDRGGKKTQSENPNEVNSIEGEKSLDPDHEPRKEGSAIKQVKQSPSVIEIGGLNDGGMQSDPSQAGDKDTSFRRGSQSRSPNTRIPGRPAHPNLGTDHSDDDLGHSNNRSLNRDSKHTRSQRKIKPMYPIPNGAVGGQKQILKVVHEDNSSGHESGMTRVPNMLQAQGINGSPGPLQLISPHGQQLGNQIIPANNQQPLQYVNSMQHMQANRNLNKMSSRERQKMMVPQHQQNKLAAYGQGGNALTGKRGSVPGGGVRHQGYQNLNRKASEERMQNVQSIGQGINNVQGGGLYSGNRKPSIEQRYKSHLRGSEVNSQVGLIRNQSKPTLQLPEIINSSAMIGSGATGKNMQQVAVDMQGRNDQVSQHSHILSNNRSKKSLMGGPSNNQNHGNLQLHSPSHIVGGYNLPQGQDPKLKNYYDMLEKNRQKSIEKYQSDLTKIYLVSQNGGQVGQSPMGSDQLGQSPLAVPQLNYQRRVVAQSPSQGDLMSLQGGNAGQNSMLPPGGNHFHNRNQSMDIVNANKIKNKLQARKNRGGQSLVPMQAVPQGMAQDDPGEGSGIDHDSGRFKARNENSRGGSGDYV